MAISVKANATLSDLAELDPVHGQRDSIIDIDSRPSVHWSQQVPVRSFDPQALNDSFELLEIDFEAEEKLLVCQHSDRENPCYTPALLAEISGLFDRLHRGLSATDRESFPFRYLVWKSRTPGIWNLGGDLAMFVRLIETGDVEGLRDYAYACIGAVYRNYAKSDLPYLTIAVVQGDALGGGFEAVLSNDIVIAEKQCQFGLPEIMFNMFPGMGAYSILSRRLGAADARAMISSGRLYSAEELHELGLIDMVVPTGAGDAGLRSFLDRNRRRHRGLLSISRVSRRCEAISQAELIDVADIWVENAMGVSSSDLRRMQRLIKAQMRRYADIVPG